MENQDQRSTKGQSESALVSRLAWGGVGVLLVVVVLRVVGTEVVDAAVVAVGVAAVLVVVATVPYSVIELISRKTMAASSLTAEKSPNGFASPGAVLGLFERPLLLLSLIAGYPVFVPFWLAFKVAASWPAWRVGDRDRQWTSLYLLKNAM